MQKKSAYFLLSLTSALLLSVAWFWHMTFFIFFAFVPLLLLEDRLTASYGPKTRLRLLGYSYLTFFTWNILVTWWVVYASLGGASMAFILNSLFMAIVFVIFSNIKNRIKRNWGVWLLIPLWIAWEHWHTLWDLSWTWLTLGNVFAFNHNWVQWYEFTGTSGGTLWILATNIIIFQGIRYHSPLRFLSKPVMRMAAIIIVPLFMSYLILLLRHIRPHSKSESVNVLVVQPNLDPYNVKFSLDYQSQFIKVLNLIRGKVNERTDYLVLPETFVTEGLEENTMNSSEAIQWFRDSLIKKFPNLKIVTGADTWHVYANEKQATPTARQESKGGKYYDAFNTALLINGTETQIYHKSKLVPGVERMPFPALLKPLESLAINMGGTMGSLGTQPERSVFTGNRGSVVAPVVCYESVYADYMTSYIRKGANLIFIITNDGWWEDTPGYKQHLNYARLRAIENRREIARSANTGISCFINEFGEISDATPWWQEAVIEKTLYPNNGLTFFSRFGDLISYLSMGLSIILLLWATLLRYSKKRV